MFGKNKKSFISWLLVFVMVCGNLVSLSAQPIPVSESNEITPEVVVESELEEKQEEEPGDEDSGDEDSGEEASGDEDSGEQEPEDQEPEDQEPEGDDEEAERTAPTLVKLHYSRDDGDYDGWDIHAWDKGNDKDGKTVEFLGEDDEHGAYAVISLPDITDEVGFIIKKNGWDEEDYPEDLIVDTSKGNQEIFVTSGVPDFISGPIKYDYDKVEVTVNYTRRNTDYDGWNLWMWPEDGDGRQVDFNDQSEESKILTHTFDDMNGKSEVGLIVRKGDWDDSDHEKDGDSDRFIDLTYANASGEVTIYLLQGDPNVYYGKVSTSITSAELMDDFMSVDFAVNIPVDAELDIELWDIKKDSKVKSSVEINDDGLTGTIKAAGELDLATPYKVTIEGYGELVVALNNIYSTKKFEEQYTYTGDLGALYSSGETEFKLWAPTASNVKVKLYDNGTTGSARATYDMVPGEKGTWTYKAAGDLNGTYYTYEVAVAGQTVEAVDPYAKAAGTNGKRGMVIDLESANPDNWKSNEHVTVPNQTDAIIYELHVRDLSVHPDSGITNKGKYKGLIETGTTHKDGSSTGLDHIKDLGVTHVHLLPVYDYLSVDESKLDTPQFNWGYDPQNYNIPEGFYSTDPSKGEVRVNEFKEMVQGLHDNGLGVIMDVVYNHLGGDGSQSNLNQIVPGYYFRMDEKGNFSNGSGCGNETASERSMMRKFMVDSVVYWAEEYNIDGFRFDLMGLHDIDTMNLIRKELDEINPKIIMYGEGWTGGDTPLPHEEQALKVNVPKLDSRIAAFSDDLRDGLKGSVFEEKEVAFINGNTKDARAAAESIKFGVVAATQHDGVDYSKVNYSKKPWAKEPTQAVSYVSAHDNHTLWDKIEISAPNATEFEKITMDKFATAIVLTSQGMPFIHAGEEMLRTKGGHENSYKSPDSVNQLDWIRKDEYKEVFDYYKGLIELRKSHPAFRMAETKQIQENLTFLETQDDAIVAFKLNGKEVVGEDWDEIVVIHNGSKEFQTIELDGNDWVSVVNSENAGVTGLARHKGNKVQVTANSTHVFVDKESYEKKAPELESKDITIYVEKPEAWEAPYMWYGKDGEWQTDELGKEPGIMEAMEGREGWYKKEIKDAKEVEFLFNNGTWDAEIKQEGQNFQVMTKVAWVTADGRLYSHDPVLAPDKEEAGDDDDEEGPAAPSELNISFKVPEEWEINEEKSLNLYYWSVDGEAYGWPGKEVEEEIDKDGWVTARVPNVKGLNLIFNNGGDDQTADIPVYSDLWIMDEKSYPYHPEEDLAVHFRKPADWENAYIHTWGDLGSTQWPGEKLVRLKDSNGNPSEWYMYVFKGDLGKKGQFVITQGPDGPQSSDLNADKTCWIDEGFKIYDNEPSMTLSIDAAHGNTFTKYFKEEAEVKVDYTGEEITRAAYTLDGSDPLGEDGISFENNEVIRFGKELNVGDEITLKVAIENEDMSMADERSYTKMEDVVIDKTKFNSLRTYQIMVAPYRDGNPDIGHGIGYGPSHHMGDFKGITEALPYIKELGMNSIWLTPIFESAPVEGQDEFADRLDATGYFTTDYFKVDPNFGTLEEAKELVDKAHELGLYVFLDGVFGHHKAGVEMPASPSGHEITPGEGAEPHNPVTFDEETLKYYQEVATYWMDELEIDGWRLDQSYQVSNPIQDENYWRQIREAVEEKSEERKAAGHKWGTLGYMVGEDWSEADVIQERAYGPDFAPGLHSAFDFPGRYKVVQVLAGQEHTSQGRDNQPAKALNEVFDSHDMYANHAVPNLMLGNHDLVRFGNLIQRAKHLGYGKENPDYWKRHKAAISFIASYTGPITLYYGEEIGMESEGYVNSGDTIPGYVVADDNIARTPGRLPTDGDGYTKDEQDLHDYTQKLMKLRSENSELWNGKRTHLLSTDTKYADLKQDGSKKMVYLLNTGTDQETFQLDQSKIGGRKLVDGITGEEIKASGGKYTIKLDGLAARFLKVSEKSGGSGSDHSDSSGSSDKPEKPQKPEEIDLAISKTLENISKSMTQNLKVADGKASVSASQAVKQFKEAEKEIKELEELMKKEGVEPTKSIQRTLSLKLDEDLEEVSISIPEDLWENISKETNISISLKGVELIVESKTFKEKGYTIDVKHEGKSVNVTSDSSLEEPLVVNFPVDELVKNYPTVYQELEDGKKVVGGIFDPKTGTIKVPLLDFGKYVVEESAAKAFDDTNDLTWERKAIDELSARGYIAGMTEESFEPHNSITRAEFSAMLSRVVPTLGEIEPINFTDIKEDAWYYNSIATAVNQGWLVGRDDDKFDPSTPVTRQELASVLSRILGQKGYLQTKDSAQGVNVASWAKDAVSLYLREVDTEEIKSLDMGNSATRGEATVMIYELLQK